MGVIFVCDHCGKQAAGRFYRQGGVVAPLHWKFYDLEGKHAKYIKSFIACSAECFGRIAYRLPTWENTFNTPTYYGQGGTQIMDIMQIASRECWFFVWEGHVLAADGNCFDTGITPDQLTGTPRNEIKREQARRKREKEAEERWNYHQSFY